MPQSPPIHPDQQPHRPERGTLPRRSSQLRPDAAAPHTSRHFICSVVGGVHDCVRRLPATAADLANAGGRVICPGHTPNADFELAVGLVPPRGLTRTLRQQTLACAGLLTAVTLIAAASIAGSCNAAESSPIPGAAGAKSRFSVVSHSFSKGFGRCGKLPSVRQGPTGVCSSQHSSRSLYIKSEGSQGSNQGPH